MNILFLHKSFPAQFLNLALSLGENPNNKVVYLTSHGKGELAGVRRVQYKLTRAPSKEVHRYLRDLEDAVLHAQAAYREAAKLKAEGFIPDIIYGHSGWGPTMYMKDLFPKTPLVCYFEWFYNAYGGDAAFWPEEKLSIDAECRIKTKNSPILIDLYSSDYGVSPTFWQKSQFPSDYSDKIKVLYDGVNTEFFKPEPNTKMVIDHAGLNLSETEEIVTYVGRGMEPYRGFPQFMEAMSIVMARRPKCHVVVVGTDRSVYTPGMPDGKTYKELMLEKFAFDQDRLHFTGHLPYSQYAKVLKASMVHVYLTRPFVLSWSFLDSMSSGCALVCSDTPPVKEFVTDKINGLLADFRSPQDIADKVEELIIDRSLRKGVSKRVREYVLTNLSLNEAVHKQMNYLSTIVNNYGSQI